MTAEQFKYWFNGFIADKKQLNEEQLNLVKKELEKVFDYKFWWTNPYEVYNPHIQPAIPSQPLKWEITSTTNGAATNIKTKKGVNNIYHGGDCIHTASYGMCVHESCTHYKGNYDLMDL